MVIFEDLHWIDEQTQALLNLLADSIGTAKILLLVNYRPEYSHQWNSKTYYTQLRLDPLGKESAEEMLSSLLATARIWFRSNGSSSKGPRAIRSSWKRWCRRCSKTARWCAMEGSSRQVAGRVKIPPTVQDILASRIDRLPPSRKRLLQTLAVIGREFPLVLVRAVDPDAGDELNRMLADLQLGEFIYEQPAAGDIEYIFKHALTQEVAYNSLLIERRKLLHERAAPRSSRSSPSHSTTIWPSWRITIAAATTREGGRISWLRGAAGDAALRHAEAIGQLIPRSELLPKIPDNAARIQRRIGAPNGPRAKR